MLNIKLLNQIKDYFKQHPEELNMRVYACGTQCCIAGLAIRLAGNYEDNLNMDDVATIGLGNDVGNEEGMRRNSELCKKATALIGFRSTSESYFLFNLFGWDDKDNRGTLKRYENAPTATERVDIVCEVIDRFIAKDPSSALTAGVWKSGLPMWNTYLRADITRGKSNGTQLDGRPITNPTQ